MAITWYAAGLSDRELVERLQTRVAGITRFQAEESARRAASAVFLGEIFEREGELDLARSLQVPHDPSLPRGALFAKFRVIGLSPSTGQVRETTFSVIGQLGDSYESLLQRAREEAMEYFEGTGSPLLDEPGDIGPLLGILRGRL